MNVCKKIILAALLLMVLCLCGCTSKSEYAKAGDEFSSWINEDPNTWSDAEKEYFNDVVEYSANN